jgi:hypothetical protein
MTTNFKQEIKQIVMDYMRENNITMLSSDYDFRTMGQELVTMVDESIMEIMSGVF